MRVCNDNNLVLEKHRHFERATINNTNSYMARLEIKPIGGRERRPLY